MSFDSKSRPEFEPLADAAEMIRGEMQRGAMWFEWLSDAYTANGHCLFLSGESWKVSPLYFGSRRPSEMIQSEEYRSQEIDKLGRFLPDMFPESTTLLRQIESINYAAFSKLEPHSSLEEHRHRNPGSLILHMALDVPSGGLAGLQVGNERHLWRERGQQIVFDDNQLHGAWNDSDQERVVLYVDFSRGLDDGVA